MSRNGVIRVLQPSCSSVTSLKEVHSGADPRKASKSATSAGHINLSQDAGQTQNVANSCEALVSVAGKPSHATKEYLENSEKPEACFQCFANKGPGPP